jgi:L-aminopeptidase/D-esterase-like protein
MLFMRRHGASFVGAIAMTGLLYAQAQQAVKPVTKGLTDVPGVKVGHFTLSERPTGCTVILTEAGAVAGVDVRGAAPATRETDVLNPVNIVQVAHAIVLSGGSGWPGRRWRHALSRRHKIGFAFGQAHVPIVPAAALFDLSVGDGRIRPNADCGYQAAVARRMPPSWRNMGRGRRRHRREAGGMGRR